MGRGSSKGRNGIGGGANTQPTGIDTAKTIQEAFNVLNMGDYIELRTQNTGGVWLPYKRTAWGFSRVSRPGYYNMPGDSMVMVRDFSKYDNRWRKLTDYNKQMFNL